MDNITIFDYLKIKKKYKYIEDFILKEKDNTLYIADIEYWDNPHFVLDRINNRDIRREIINILIETSYDFKSQFPYSLDKLQKFKLLDSVKNNLKLEYKYYNTIFFNNDIILTKDKFKCLICNISKNILPYVFRFNYDIFINTDRNNKIIVLNNRHKKHYSLNTIYKILDNIEPDIWIQRADNMIKVKQYAQSSISNEQIKNIIIENSLKIEN